MAENSGFMKKHSNATNFSKGVTKDSAMTLANAGTLGFAGVANKAFFQQEKKRIEALNKKVIENCTDIKNIASILQRNYDSSSLHLTEDELLNIVNITRRSDDEICENSLNYDSEMDTARNMASKVKKIFSPGFISNDRYAVAAGEDPSGRIFKEIDSEQLKKDSPPVSRPSTPEMSEVFDFDNLEIYPLDQPELLSTTKSIDFDKGGKVKKSKRKSKKKPRKSKKKLKKTKRK